MASPKLLAIVLTITVLSIFGADANPTFRRQPKVDQVPISKPSTKNEKTHAFSDGLSCGYLEKAGRDFPCGKMPTAADAKRYRIRQLTGTSLEECAHSCFNSRCYSFEHLDGRCTLFDEEAFFIKDIMDDRSGPLYDMRCFNCS